MLGLTCIQTVTMFVALFILSLNKISMKPIIYTIFLAVAYLSFSCDNNTVDPAIEAPATYSFERNGQSTVSFSGQTTRINMADELVSSMLDFTATETLLLEMYRNETAGGGDANPFDDPDLNASTKSVRSKTAASRDYFSSNSTESMEIRNEFEDWISLQVSDVYSAKDHAAIPGVAGQLADGSSTRYVNELGLEYNQMVGKSLIGALMLDQSLNNYLSTSVLDDGDNVINNDQGVTAEGANYTTMEHKWDEAYGYFYGTAQNPAEPNLTLGEDDNFMNKYIGRVENDLDFTGIADEIYNAFKLGRAAIVQGMYNVRDDQADIIREKASEIMGIRAVYYLQQAKISLPDDRNNTAAYGPAFHDLSEAYGFIYSLRFTRKPGTNDPYFTKAQVDGFLSDLLGDGPNGLWDIQLSTLDELSLAIAEKFNFTVEQAGS